MSSSLWYNNLISDIPLFFPIWYKSGITLVGDIINPETKTIMDFD